MGAPSGYLGYIVAHESNEISEEICVPNLTPTTFYSLLNWNAGQNDNMAGYAGFKVLKNGQQTFHFAIWDPNSVIDKPKSVSLHKDGKELRFGGEGEGMKVIMPFNFVLGEWYRVRIKIEHPDKQCSLIYCFLT